MALTGKPETRSWASIVKGASKCVDNVAMPNAVKSNNHIDYQSSSPPEVVAQSPCRDVDIQPIQPAVRGSYKYYCQGEVLMMCGHYGWIKAFQEINQLYLAKTAGRIYVHKRDVINGAMLMPGDKVSFYLYVDDKGLGAEYCHVLTRNAGSPPVFVPSQVWAATAWNVSVDEFVPKPCTQAVNFTPFFEELPCRESQGRGCEHGLAAVSSKLGAVDPTVIVINPALLDSDDEASTCGDGCGSSVTWGKESEMSDVNFTDEDDGLVTEALCHDSKTSDDGNAIRTQCGSKGKCDSVLKAPLWKAFPSGFYPPPGLSSGAN